MTPEVKAYRKGQNNKQDREDPWVQLLNLDRGDADKTVLWMNPTTARRVGNALIEAACWLEEHQDDERTFRVEVSR